LGHVARVVVEPAQQLRVAVAGQAQPDDQVGLSAARLAAIEQLVGLAEVGLGLRPRVRHPDEPRGAGRGELLRLGSRLRVELRDAVEQFVEDDQIACGCTQNRKVEPDRFDALVCCTWLATVTTVSKLEDASAGVDRLITISTLSPTLAPVTVMAPAPFRP